MLEIAGGIILAPILVIGAILFLAMFGRLLPILLGVAMLVGIAMAML